MHVMRKMVISLLVLFILTGLLFNSSVTVHAASTPPTATVIVDKKLLGIGQNSDVTITFSEAVVDFSLYDMIVNYATLSNLTTSDNINYKAILTPAAGITSVNNYIVLDNSAVVSRAGVIGVGLTYSIFYNIDTVRPTATIAVANSVLLAGQTSLVTFTFSEAVTGFDNADLSVPNGTLSDVSSSDGGITWTATFTPDAWIKSAINVITLDNTKVADLAGNAGSGRTTSGNYAINTVRPTATIVVAKPALNIGSTSNVTITFSEAVTGFSNASLAVANGTLSSVSSADGGITWMAEFTPAPYVTDSTNVISLDNTGVENATGNTGVGTTHSNNYAIDTVRPTSTIVVSQPYIGIGQTSRVTITFSEPVTGVTNTALTVMNGTLSNVISSDGGITWTATFTPATGITNATNVITFDNTKVMDLAGNAGTGIAKSNNYIVDMVPPTATITVANPSLLAGQTTQVTFTFSEKVTGFTNACLTISNGTLSDVSSSDGITWTATFTPTAGITNTTNLITLDNTKVADLVGNAGTGSTTSGNYMVQTVRPTSSVVVGDTSLTFGETSRVKITFSEAVMGFTNAALTAENGTLSDVVSTDGGITWTATFTPQANVSAAANHITLDNSGVKNLAGNSGQGTTESNPYSVSTIPASAELRSLTLSDGDLSPSFVAGTTVYTSDVPYSTSTLSVTAVVADSRAVVTVNDIQVAAGQPSSPLQLNVGANTITVHAATQQGTSKTYVITVTRAAMPSLPSGGGNSTTSTDGKLTLAGGQAGQVSLGDAVGISIPAGATQKELILTISKVADTRGLLTSKQVLASSVYEILKNFPENFSKPVMLTIAFDPTSLGKDQRAAIFYYDEGKKVWVEVSGSQTTGNHIAVEVDHFTKYAVFAADSSTSEPALDIQFSDISGHWAEANIKLASSQGIVKGYADGAFHPNATVTRAEFAVMLMNALKLQTEGAELNFSDTAKIGAWAKKAIAQGVQAGIMKGNSDGSFHPDAEVTRAEMAVMLANALEQTVEVNATTGFTDDKDIPAWAKTSIAIVKQAGIVQGIGNNRFAPGDHATRAEAVTVLLNLLAHRTKQGER